MEVNLITSEDDKIYGNLFSLQTEVTGLGEFTYSWSKDGELIQGYHKDYLILDPLEFEDQGLYQCTVTSNLTADDADPGEDSFCLDGIEKATPKIELNFQPEDNYTFQNEGVSITAFVHHERESVSGIAIPTGEVQFTICDQNTDELQTLTVPLENGIATTEKIHLKSGSYSVKAEYNPGEDPHYKSTDVIEEYTISKKKKSNSDYIASGPSFDGWYNIEHPLKIWPNPNGEYDKIRFDEQANLENELNITEETTTEGRTIFFQLVDSASGEFDCYDYSFRSDYSPPSKLEMDFYPVGLCICGHFSAQDNNEVKYFRIDFKDDSVFVKAKNNKCTYPFSNYGRHTSECFVSVTAYDVAGNSSETKKQRIKRIFVDVSRDENAEQINEIVYHNQSIVFTLHAYNREPEVDDINVAINDTVVENLEWTYVAPNAEENAEGYYQAVVTTPDEEGSYQLHITAPEYVFTDNEFESEEDVAVDGHYENGTYVSLTHILDKTNPIITFQYDPESLEDGFTAYPNSRSCSVMINEAHFNPERLSVPKEKFRITDITGTPLPDEKTEELRIEIETILKQEPWKEENGIYKSAELVLSQDGIYGFVIECTDKANNYGVSNAQSFTLDSTAPQELSIRYETSAIGILSNNGFYNPKVEVTVTARDMSSGVDHFDIVYQPQEGSCSLNDKEKAWQIPHDELEYDETGAVASAHFTLTADEYRQYRGSLCFTATDGAGNVSVVHNADGIAVDADGKPVQTDEDFLIVIDTIAPTCTVSYPEPQLLRQSTDMAVVEGGWKAHAKEKRTDYILYYDHNSSADIPVTVNIQEANFDPQDKNLMVKVNNEAYHIDWTCEAAGLWTGVIHLQADGAYRISIDYTDRCGNQMESYKSNLIVIDRMSPTVDYYEFDPLTSAGEVGAERFVEHLEYGYYFKTDFAVTVHTSDPFPSSGLNSVYFRLLSYQDGKFAEERNQTVKISDGKATLEIPAGFKGQIFASCSDFADNRSAEVTPYGLIVDQVAPTIEITTNNATPHKDALGNRLFTETTTITVTVRDTVSGLREVGWRQSTELHSTDRSVTYIANNGLRIGDTLDGGWVVVAMDRNLVTELRKTFTYTEDDNDITLIVDAMDRSHNKRSDVRSETFTVDKTAPVITVDFTGGGINNGVYYQEKRKAVVSVTERNFDPGRIHVDIKNAFGAIPVFAFNRDGNSNRYTAQIEFDEGDYTFGVSGTDLGSHNATITYAGGNERAFVIDLTNPHVVTNFASFTDESKHHNFNQDMEVAISITEHNFDANLTHLRIYQKKAGAPQTAEQMTDITEKVLQTSSWVSSGDTHTFTFLFTEDAVYQVVLAPTDRTGRKAVDGEYKTVVFEIDKTPPVIFMRTGALVKSEDNEFRDIYNSARKNDPAPTVSFNDLHIAYISYELTVWVPNYSDYEAYPKMTPEKRFVSADVNRTGVVQGDTFRLDGFEEDGIYTVELIAYDVAGNPSAKSVNTYIRIAQNEILAYIKDSSISKKTGLFSFEDKDGRPISLRADMLKDLTIMVFGETGMAAEVLLRDSNGEEYVIGELIKTEQNTYGVDTHTYQLLASKFTDLFPDDADTNLILTVRSGSNRIDLGMIHIDNMIPTCNLPDDFYSWKWYVGNKDRTIVLTGISEELDISQCAIFDNKVKIPFEYSSEERTITFTLEKGWHDVGIVLCDLAGNKNNIQELTKIHVGLFWLWIILVGVVMLLGCAAFLVVRAKRKRAMMVD